MARGSRAKSRAKKNTNQDDEEEAPVSRMEQISAIQSRLLSTDTSQPLPGLLSDALRRITDVILPSLIGDASSSVVLLNGTRGSGKTTILKRFMHDLSLELSEPPCVIINLDGLLYNGALGAFRAIARGLGGTGIGSSQHCLGEISLHITKLRDKHIPILFVLEEFEKFVNHPSVNQTGQTVLYAIFNLLQDTKLMAAVLCLTTQIDIIDHLEKRVKSRFCHRTILVKVPKSYEQVSAFLEHVMDGSKEGTGFLKHKTVVRALNRQFQRDRAMGPIVAALDSEVLSRLAHGTENDRDAGEMVAALENSLESWGSTRDFILGLSTLELALVVALTRLERTSNSDGNTDSNVKDVSFMFDDVYREYEGLATGGEESIVKNQIACAHIEPKNMAARAWDRVVEAGLVIRQNSSNNSNRALTLAVAPDCVLDALKDAPAATTLMQRWGVGAAIH